MKLLIILILLIFFKNVDCENLDIVNEEEINVVLNVQDVKFAQTHVIPAEGKRWVIKNREHILKLVPGRSALLMAKFDDINDNSIFVRVLNGEKEEGTIKMKLPNQLPPTEDNGPRYSTVHHSCIIPGEWIKNDQYFKIQFETTAKNNQIKSKIIKPKVGQERVLVLWTLPIYLFGANDINSAPFSKVKQVDNSIVLELVQKWSVTNIKSSNHKIGKINWPYLIVPPRNGNKAKKITNSSQKSDTFEIMDQILLILKGIRYSWGDSSSSSLIYSPLLQLDSNGNYEDPYGGLGCVGGSVSTGDYLYTGVFIHEIGHSFGLHHAGNQYNKGEYPYIKGSLKGSEWGYDINKNEFLSIYIPKSSKSYKHCQKYYLISDDGKYCIKNTIMQDGDGNQASNYKYSMFSDYEMVTIQNYFERSIYYDSISNRYMKFNSSINKYYNYKPRTKEYGLYGIVNEGIPIEKNIDIYTIVLTYSTVGPSELSQFYPILKSNGNLIKYFDPTNQTDIKAIDPNSSSSLSWYCYESGCDYTVRITFSDGSVQYILLSKGKRKWWMPTSNTVLDGLYNPYSLDSFLLFVLNVKVKKDISIRQLQLLDTPFAFNGISKNHNYHKILMSQIF